MGLLLSRPVFQRYIMKRLALILLMLGMIAGAAIPQMTPTFTGKLYNRAWYQSVPETWASYLMQLNVGGVTKIQFNADGSATFAGDITANGVVLGAGGGASAIGDLSDWPAGVSATEVGYLDGLTGALTGLLAAKAPLAGPAFTGSPTVNGHLTISTTATTANLTVGASTVTVNDSRAALEVPAGGLVRPVAGADEAGTTLYVFSADGGEGGGATGGGNLNLAAGCSRPLALDQVGIGEAQPGGNVEVFAGNGGYAAGGTNDNGATGGSTSIVSGQGGATATNSSGTGGLGGYLQLWAGTGGNQTGANGTAGNGGDVLIKAGKPGRVGTGTPGTGGAVRIYSASTGVHTERLTLTDTALTVTGIPIVTGALKVTGTGDLTGKVLTSDADGDGSWTTPSVTAPAGNDKQLQYNDNGSFGAANATWEAGRFEIGTTATGATLLVHSDRATPFTNYLISDVAAQIWPGLQFDLSAAAGVTPASGLGADMRMLMQTSTTASQPASRIETQWLDATHATRKAQLGLYVSEAHGEEVGLRIEGTSGTPNVIGGYSGNAVTAGKVGAFIGGGGYASNVNSVTGDYCAILGGFKNTATGGYGAAVVAGVGNTAGQQYAFVGGGYSNTASAHYSSVLGGANNTAATRYSSILAGAGNITNTAYYSSVLGGKDNTIEGGYYAVAGGRLAYVTGYGTFAWSDSTDARFDSTTTNEFAVRATGGVRFVTDYTTTVDDNVDSFTDAGDWFNIAGHAFANGDQVRLTTTGALPTGLAIDTDYWIINNDGAKFNVASAPNSTTVRTFSGTGSGTATVKKFAKTGARIDTAGVLQADGGYKSADGTAGMTDTRSWDDAVGNTHAVTIKNGLITAWTVTPP